MFGIGRGILGTIMGPFFVFLSLVLVFVNEGRQDMSVLAERAPLVSADVLLGDDEQLVSAMGVLMSDQLLSDGVFLHTGQYIAVRREVEQFSKATMSGYEDDRMHISSQSNELASESFRVTQARVGAYSLVIADLDLPKFEPLLLDTTVVQNISADKISGEFIYLGTGTLDGPNLGDLRVSYQVLRYPMPVLVYGQTSANYLVPFQSKQGTLYRAFVSDPKTAVTQLHSEFKTTRAFGRVLIFLLMWLGVYSLTAIVRALVRFVPVVGGLTRVLFAGISFVVALLLNYLARLLATAVYNWFILAGIGVLLVGFGFWLYMKKKAKTEIMVEDTAK